MIAVNRNKVEIPKILFSPIVEKAIERLREFYYFGSEKRIQKKFYQPFNPSIRKGLLPAMRALFDDKCCYCESKIGPAGFGVIDNFRPKSGARGLDKDFNPNHYWWLTYEWENLYYSCQNCNRYKSTWFPIAGKIGETDASISELNQKEAPLFIDPCIDNPEKEILYKTDGTVYSESKKGQITIELLKLNREELVQARLDAIQFEFGEWETILKNWNKKRTNVRAILINWDKIMNGESDQPYLGIRRFLIRDRLSTQPEISDYFKKKLFLQTDEVESVAIEKPTGVMKYREFIKEKEAQESKEIDIKIDTSNFKRVFLKKIELHNYKCFDHLEVDLDTLEYASSSGDDIEEPWKMLLGENGMGKSSILQGIAYSLMGNDYLKRMKVSANTLLKRGKRKGYIKLFVQGQDPIEVTFDSKQIESTLPTTMSYLIGYGSVRLLPSKRLKPESRNGAVKCQNLFDHSVALLDADKWVLSLSKEEFDRVAIALKDLIGENDNSTIRIDPKDKCLLVSLDGNDMKLSDLSDGYKTILLIAMDIMAMIIREKEKISFNIAEGIVLIDELGNHLHPRWKMTVVKRLRKTFPRIQFIVTSHEPLCLLGLKNKEVTVLKKDIEGKVISNSNLPDPSSYRVDQILTSDFFGMHSTIDPEVEMNFNRYYILLAKEDKLSPEEKEEISELQLVINRHNHLGNSLRDELAYYAIDKLLANQSAGADLSRDELKSETLKKVSEVWARIKNNSNND